MHVPIRTTHNSQSKSLLPQPLLVDCSALCFFAPTLQFDERATNRTEARRKLSHVSVRGVSYAGALGRSRINRSRIKLSTVCNSWILPKQLRMRRIFARGEESGAAVSKKLRKAPGRYDGSHRPASPIDPERYCFL